MRGANTFIESPICVRKLEAFVPASHPLRPIHKINAALVKTDALFSRMYEADIKGERPSITPEKLLRAMPNANWYCDYFDSSTTSIREKKSAATHDNKRMGSAHRLLYSKTIQSDIRPTGHAVR